MGVVDLGTELDREPDRDPRGPHGVAERRGAGVSEAVRDYLLAAYPGVALSAGARVTGYGFLVFSLSSLVWVVTGTAQQEIALVVQYLVLLAINLFGVYRWLVKNDK